jgi:hypothetical protein
MLGAAGQGRQNSSKGIQSDVLTTLPVGHGDNYSFFKTVTLTNSDDLGIVTTLRAEGRQNSSACDGLGFGLHQSVLTAKVVRTSIFPHLARVDDLGSRSLRHGKERRRAGI